MSHEEEIDPRLEIIIVRGKLALLEDKYPPRWKILNSSSPSPPTPKPRDYTKEWIDRRYDIMIANQPKPRRKRWVATRHLYQTPASGHVDQ